MINSKLHNPIIAKNSHIGNAVVEKVTAIDEATFSDLENTTPVVPETGRIWFNTDEATFKFANIDGTTSYVDEFLSRTDKRAQSITSTVDFKNTIKVLNTDSTEQLVVNSAEKTIVIDNSNSLTVTTGTVTLTTPNVDAAITTSLTVTDGSNAKIVADNLNDSLTFNYANINTTGMNVKVAASNTITISNGLTDKFIIDNTNDLITVNYATIIANATDTNINVTDSLEITDGSNTKIKADNTVDILTINYASTNLAGDMSVSGNMVVTGDLTVGGQATRVDIKSESLSIADNIIILNSNLTDEDPRLASAIVDGEDVDHNAGVAVNRGSEGILSLIQWVESTDTSTPETLKEGTAQVSIWNYEADTPAYELSQIIEAYTLGREVKDLSGASKVGYDGEVGINYQNAIDSGASAAEASEYSFKLDADKLDAAIDTLVQKIDADSYNDYNTVRVGETPTAGTSFTITHNLGTVFVDVKIQREEDGKWYFDILPIEVVDSNTIHIETTESTKIRYMISAIQGFDIDHETELVVN